MWRGRPWVEHLTPENEHNTISKEKAGTAHVYLLGFWGKRVQLLQWMISLTTATSVGGGGGTSPRPGIIGLIGVIPVIMLRPGSKPGTQIESAKHTRQDFGKRFFTPWFLFVLLSCTG